MACSLGLETYVGEVIAAETVGGGGGGGGVCTWQFSVFRPLALYCVW